MKWRVSFVTGGTENFNATHFLLGDGNFDSDIRGVVSTSL
ncbi:hypothetical protein PDE_03120 [Penicillium oxalicum 114-2]|uniref:Uncharacterized protein n=1 Tax=Penicillium oxalicum (strain 114-2 / CGMCC 5302) TaxID=933388 RepID=S7ZD32_PENO1|nr:hypothetical protein PDE_03120 [Penicillium oxalicum 114-2]